MGRISTATALLASSLAAWSVSWGRQEPPPAGTIDRARVELVLLDVEVVDKAGEPVRGLSLEDFRLKLDSRDWPVYSVDDYCTEPLEAAGASPSRPADSPASVEEPGDSGTEAPADPSRLRFVIYFDFSELRMDGRRSALKAARHWVDRAMRPTDEAMVMGYLSRGGLTELCPFTSDAARLLAAIDAAGRDPDLADSFPLERVGRVSDCKRCLSDKIICQSCDFMRIHPTYCCPQCGEYAREEYFHDRRSMSALKDFLSSLEGMPGRKAVLFFYQNTSISAGTFYYMPNSEYTVGNLDQTLEEVGANATSARAVLYPMQVAGSQFGSGGPAVDLGWELAKYTGGRHNRSLSDLDDVLARAARLRPCTYRIAFEPPDPSRSGVYRVDVRAKGGSIPFEFRVQHLTQADRAVRKARSVLARPESASELTVRAAILPRRFDHGRWDLGIQAILDVGSSGLLRTSSGQGAELDIGGLFYEAGGGGHWELLTGTSLRTTSSGEIEGDVVYARTQGGLAPGTYRLTVFARNKLLDLYGGASRELTVPDEGETMLLGPFALLARKRHLLVHLPLKKEATDETGRHARLLEGAVWAGEGPVQPGVPIEVVTWLCPSSGVPDTEGAERFVSREDVPLYRLPEPRISNGGDCAILTDSIDTHGLREGTYTYNIAWRPENGPPLHGELSFGVAHPRSPE